MDPRSLAIGGQTIDARGDYARQPWRSLSADSLRKVGYVYDERDMRTYNAPDLGVLLSEQFVEDHCMRIAPESSPERLGIEFAPNADRKKAEIRGTLWLNRATNELQEMEYRYANIPRDEERIAGGTLGFTRMRNGMWAISRWSIRMPMFVARPVPLALRVDKSIDSIKVTGGELVVATITSPRGRDTLWIRPRIRLNGVIVDSISGAPVARAVVALGGTIQVDTSDTAGRFTINGVLPGRYALNVRTPSLDSVNTVDQRTILFTDSSISMTVRVPNARLIVGSICGRSPSATRWGSGMVIGTVMRDTGDSLPVANAKVFAEWDQIIIGANGTGSRRHVMETRTDNRGVFRHCGLPVTTVMRFTAETDSARANPQTISLAENQVFGRVDLVMVHTRRLPP